MIEPNREGPDYATFEPRGYLKGIFLGKTSGVAWLNGGYLDVIMREPLPGIVIFVHGVNSDGEWYAPAEQGLCNGLNDRLKRRGKQMAYPTPEGGQLTPATYLPELTADGYINPEMKFNTFMGNDEHFTPVIHFRWGYKASSQELQDYGKGIYLNEEDYWGGGPFGNGCTSLPDLWSRGLSDNLMLWLQIEHLNPASDRIVFSCPPRPYHVLAALRLARLVASIRTKQADVPITIVCHSQGNMVGMAAAFLGDDMAPVKDTAGVEGRCVADTYVLCNPPYSLAESNFTENWSARDTKDKHGGTGRQTLAARVGTLRAFLDIIRRPASRPQQAEDIDRFMANETHDFSIAADRMVYGYGIKPTTCGRVTLYCNPHDEVISSTSIIGIGWRGLCAAEIDAVGGVGIFCQRVFAQDYAVGSRGKYHYWDNHYQHPPADSPKFWVPESLEARYSVMKGHEADRGHWFAQIITLVTAPVFMALTWLAGYRINALPHKNWEIPLDAPNLPQTFYPKAVRFGVLTDRFDEGYAAPGQDRDKARGRGPDERYAGDRPMAQNKDGIAREATDAALGNQASESALRYDDHARLRMQARREGLVRTTDEHATGEKEHVIGEDKPELSNAEYKAWSAGKIKTYLADTIDTHATDHSTILTNSMHAEQALAYDVAIGHCHIRDKDLHALRVAADWRFLTGLDDGDPSKEFKEYFARGKFKGDSAFDWAHAENSEGRMPGKIVDQRENLPPRPRAHPSPRGSS